jgi:hypothetical protein
MGAAHAGTLDFRSANERCTGKWEMSTQWSNGTDLLEESGRSWVESNPRCSRPTRRDRGRDGSTRRSTLTWGRAPALRSPGKRRTVLMTSSSRAERETRKAGSAHPASGKSASNSSSKPSGRVDCSTRPKLSRSDRWPRRRARRPPPKAQSPRSP